MRQCILLAITDEKHETALTRQWVFKAKAVSIRLTIEAKDCPQWLRPYTEIATGVLCEIW